MCMDWIAILEGSHVPMPIQGFQSFGTTFNGSRITPLPNRATFLNLKEDISRLGEGASTIVVSLNTSLHLRMFITRIILGRGPL